MLRLQRCIASILKFDYFVATSTIMRSCVLCVCAGVLLCEPVCVLSEVILFSLLTGSKTEVRPWLAAVINALPQ